MKTLLKAARAVAVTLAMFVFATYIADAAPSVTKKSRPAPVQSATPYSLSLSLGENWNVTSTGLPKTTVAFVNSSSHTLAFFLTSAFSQFTVEYKMAKGDVTSNAGWQMLRSSRQLPPSNASSGNPAATETFDILFKIAPKQEDKTVYALDDFPMSKVGLYRITAFTKVPNVSELDGPASSPSVVRTFTLDIRSNSVIVRRTVAGFAEVPTAASKPAPTR